MVTRRSRIHSPKTGFSGGSRLTLAGWIVALEAIVQSFAPPLMLAGFFIVLAWLGVFTALYPWLHMVALALFVAAFCDALGRARLGYRPASKSLAKRRVEAASGLKHRPLDVFSDHPIAAD